MQTQIDKQALKSELQSLMSLRRRLPSLTIFGSILSGFAVMKLHVLPKWNNYGYLGTALVGFSIAAIFKELYVYQNFSLNQRIQSLNFQYLYDEKLFSQIKSIEFKDVEIPNETTLKILGYRRKGDLATYPEFRKSSPSKSL